MAGYDFSALSPHEFEELTRDLLEKKYDVPFQTFTEGPDGGIDLRHSSVSTKQWIVQCKHFAKSSFNSLKSHLKKELEKIQNLKPERYIFITSLGLTPKNVDGLFDLLQPYCVSKHDIIGKDDLNGILRDNPEIVKSHYKLWITSEAVLSQVLHNDVMVQSSMTKEEIRKRLGLYVFTDMYNRAKSKLESDGVSIISGDPGVGKTTLAEMLLVDYLMQDWQIVTIQQNISEALRVLREDPKSKQIFYYDDFLGQIKSGAKLAKNEDRTLLQLMKSISSSKTKRFILTTREFILAQAKEEHEQLARSDIDIFQFVIKCDEYNNEAKAKILANHLFYFGVQQNYIAAIIKDENYRKIINHKNYSPRIIESMTSRFDFSMCDPSQYHEEFISNLNNPSEIWFNAYHHLSEAAQHLLLSAISCGGAVFTKDLKQVFERFWAYRSNIYGMQRRPDDFLRALRELEGNFILIHQSGENRVIELHNPSILDFIENFLQENPETIQHVIESAICFEQIICLSSTLGIMKYVFDITSSSNRIIGEAIERTFSTDNLTVSRGRFKSAKWTTNSSGQWERLKGCLKIAEESNNKHIQNVVEEIAKKSLSQQCETYTDLPQFLDTVDFISYSEWVSEETKNLSFRTAKKKLLSNDFLREQALDDLVNASYWLAQNMYEFGDIDYNKCVGAIADIVSSEIHVLSTEDDPDKLESTISSLDELESYIDLDFSIEKQILEEAIAKCPPDDLDVGYGSSNPTPITVFDNSADESMIKSIFNSLIE